MANLKQKEKIKQNLDCFPIVFRKIIGKVNQKDVKEIFHKSFKRLNSCYISIRKYIQDYSEVEEQLFELHNQFSTAPDIFSKNLSPSLKNMLLHYPHLRCLYLGNSEEKSEKKKILYCFRELAKNDRNLRQKLKIQTRERLAKTLPLVEDESQLEVSMMRPYWERTKPHLRREVTHWMIKNMSFEIKPDERRWFFPLSALKENDIDAGQIENLIKKRFKIYSDQLLMARGTKQKQQFIIFQTEAFLQMSVFCFFECIIQEIHLDVSKRGKKLSKKLLKKSLSALAYSNFNDFYAAMREVYEEAKIDFKNNVVYNEKPAISDEWEMDSEDFTVFWNKQ